MRDPRVDPRPGDLILDSATALPIFVVEVNSFRIIYAMPNEEQALFQVPTPAWSNYFKGDEVLHVTPDASRASR